MATSTIKFFKADTLPDIGDREPNSIYIIKSVVPGYVDLIVTDKNGTEVFKTLSPEEVITKNEMATGKVDLTPSNRDIPDNSVEAQGSMLTAERYPRLSSFKVPDVLRPHSGSSIELSSLFIHDNSSSDYGLENPGAEGPLSQEMIDFLTHLNRTGYNARYGRAFAIAKVSIDGFDIAGPYTITSPDGIVRTLTQYVNYSLASKALTTSQWVKAVDDSIVVRATWINGIRVSEDYTDYIIEPSAGWTHVTYYSANYSGYIHGGHIYAPMNSSYLISLLYLSPRKVVITPTDHFAPII